MSIEQLKKKLESDIEEIKSYHGCLTGDCPHNNSTDCCLELMNQVNEAATNRLLPLLKKAVEMAEFYSDRNNWNGYSDSHHEMMNEADHELTEDIIIISALFDSSPDSEEKEHEVKISRAGKKAREFLTEIKKESGK